MLCLFGQKKLTKRSVRKQLGVIAWADYDISLFRLDFVAENLNAFYSLNFLLDVQIKNDSNSLLDYCYHFMLLGIACLHCIFKRFSLLFTVFLIQTVKILVNFRFDNASLRRY